MGIKSKLVVCIVLLLVFELCSVEAIPRGKHCYLLC